MKELEEGINNLEDTEVYSIKHEMMEDAEELESRQECPMYTRKYKEDGVVSESDKKFKRALCRKILKEEILNGGCM